MREISLFKLKQAEQKKDKGFHFFKYVVVFLFGSLFGVIYEDLLMLIRTGNFETHRGVIFEPLNPLYGLGFVIFVFVLWKVAKWYNQLIYGSLMLGGLEYVCSFFEELLTGSTSWNYSTITNIDGRTTVIYALFWGLGAMLIIQFVYPQLLKFLLKFDSKWLRILVFAWFSVYLADIVFSHTALILCNLRAQGYASKTFIGKFFEKYFPGNVLKKYFVNKKL